VVYRIQQNPRSRMMVVTWTSLHLVRELLGMSDPRREQQKQLESTHHENQATGKEGEADDRRRKHTPWKRRNGGKPLG
jgi:hypothetical protein